MTIFEFWTIVALLIASVACIVVPIIVWVIRRLVIKQTYEPKSKWGLSRVVIFTLMIILSVWCLRFAVGFYNNYVEKVLDYDGLYWWEEIFNCLLHAKQTVSMDEDYTAYIIGGKIMVERTFGAGYYAQEIYAVYASVLNFIAPLAGGTMLLEMLAQIFPKIQLAFSYCLFWKEKYYFSALNEESLALAKSIVQTNGTAFTRPTLIFTDVNQDAGAEIQADILSTAKLLGAICVKDDLSHVKKNRVAKRRFFLIGENEEDNLKTFTALSNEQNRKYLKKAEIYLFTNTDSYVQIEQNVQKTLKDAWGVEDGSNKLPVYFPVIIPIQSYRNLITNMLVDIPLYEPLMKKPSKDGVLDLTVTVLGTGKIGTEMFLNSYWFGQILNCRLHFNIVSEQSEEDFWGKINYINPEIWHTTQKDDKILQIYRDDENVKADIYCDVSYHCCNVKSKEFIAKLSGDNAELLNTDYFFVALGSDEENISVANSVKRCVGDYHIRQASQKENVGKVIVTYVVFDSQLADTLNRVTDCNFTDSNSKDVSMHAVGDLRNLYSVKNVFMSNHEDSAQKMHEGYHALNNRADRADEHRERMKDDYKHWSTLAQGMHAKYRLFSARAMISSMADEDYKRYIITNLEGVAQEERIKFLHEMAWLEHRRWNAFMRVKGFRHTNDYAVYAGFNKSYKQMVVKLHPCLVECDKNGIRVLSDKEKNISVGPIYLASYQEGMDLLDELSYALFEKDYNGYDFKLYDYPMIPKDILDSIELTDENKKVTQQTAKILYEKKNPSKSFEQLPEKKQKGEVDFVTEQYKVAITLGYKIKSE